MPQTSQPCSFQNKSKKPWNALCSALQKAQPAGQCITLHCPGCSQQGQIQHCLVHKNRAETGLQYFATLSHPISGGILIQVKTENLFPRVNDKAERPCSTASNTHCILGNAQEAGIPTANSEFAAGFCKRPLVVFPLMNSKRCSFRNRVKKCLPNCPFNGRRNMLLLQQQTVPSCHPHMGQKARRANSCYLSLS